MKIKSIAMLTDLCTCRDVLCLSCMEHRVSNGTID